MRLDDHLMYASRVEDVLLGSVLVFLAILPVYMELVPQQVKAVTVQGADYEATMKKELAGFTQCLNKADGLEVETDTCIQTAQAEQDANLNHWYRENLARLGPTKVESFRKQQRDWQKASETYCDDQAVKQPGIALRMVRRFVGSCLVAATNGRAKELELSVIELEAKKYFATQPRR